LTAEPQSSTLRYYLLFLVVVFPALPFEAGRLELLLFGALDTLELPLEELEAREDELEKLALEAALLELV
tara:strand:- start:237 stop:446 length:210 start_codon:yes stop_codon:yes gene_type:complete